MCMLAKLSSLIIVFALSPAPLITLRLAYAIVKLKVYWGVCFSGNKVNGGVSQSVASGQAIS